VKTEMKLHVKGVCVWEREEEEEEEDEGVVV
jgi:hypothetical protein